MGTPDPLHQVMQTVISGFQQTTALIADVQQQQQTLQQQQQALQQQLQDQARAAYSGMTGSGKSRFVQALVDQETARLGDRGARSRVANTLGLTPPRITQLLDSEKNRKNGK